MQTGCPFTSSSSPLRHFLYGIMQMSWHPGVAVNIAKLELGVLY
jgi:hypothetical protein